MDSSITCLGFSKADLWKQVWDGKIIELPWSKWSETISNTLIAYESFTMLCVRAQLNVLKLEDAAICVFDK